MKNISFCVLIYVNYVPMWFKYINRMTFMISLKKDVSKILI